MATLAEEMATFVADLEWTAVPESVRDCVRGRVLDAVSTGVLGRVAPVTAHALQAIRWASPTTGPCSVLPTGASAPPDAAAFVNAVAVHALLFEDVNLSSGDHPGAVVVPAALAMAQAAEVVTGERASIGDLLSAVLAGYEVHLWLGSLAANGMMRRGLRTTSILGAVGAAAAACTALRLSEERVGVALALASTVGAGHMEGFLDGTEEPYLQAGFASRAGLWCALLAEDGVTASATAFEGSLGFLRGLADVTAPVSTARPDHWLVPGVSIKPYPVSGGKIAAIDSALALLEQGIDMRRVRSVRAIVPSWVKDFPPADKAGPFATTYQAQESIQFCVAAALLGRPMGSISTVVDGYADSEIAELTSKIELVGEPGRTLTRITVTLTDGSSKSAEVDWSDRQLSTIDAMVRKVDELSFDVWPAGSGTELAELLSGPPGTPLSRLTAALDRPRVH